VSGRCQPDVDAAPVPDQQTGFYYAVDRARHAARWRFPGPHAGP
jgi:hypothetical protein